MLGRLQALLVLAVSVAAVPAAAQTPDDESTSDDGLGAEADTAPALAEEPAAEEPTAEEPAAEEPTAEEPAAEEPTAEEPTAEEPTDERAAQDRRPVGLHTELAAAGEGSAQEPSGESTLEDLESAQANAEPPGPASDTRLKLNGGHRGWETGVTGYFRAPIAIGISQRPGPDDPDGPAQTQLSYGPNRTVDANYYSFAYTRLQEQDWAELAIYARKKHVEAAVGWMGYWYQTVGFRNPDAGWFPGIARLTLDTDFDVGGLEANIALTGGAWWPRFGYFEKYDTYTLGLFRHLGEQVRLELPFTSDLTVALYQGFGTGRDGDYNYQIGAAPPIYGAKTGMNLLHNEHLRVTYKDLVDVGLHFSNQWTRDPNLTQTDIDAKSFSDAAQAHLTVVGGELDLRAAPLGRLWVSPSYIHVRNGWALAENGTEVMHALGGAGVATNYLAWSNSPRDSTGSGSMLNVGAMYQNSLSGIQGRRRGTVMPDVTLSVFGLMTNAKLDLPENSQVTQDRIKQLKYGADVELQALDWLGVMLRYDEVNYDLDNSGYIFSAISPRLTFSSHFLSTESIYIQYSRYRYGDRMVLAGQWPWGVPLIAGSDIIQGGTYEGWKPDMDVIRLQATIAF